MKYDFKKSLHPCPLPPRRGLSLCLTSSVVTVLKILRFCWWRFGLALAGNSGRREITWVYTRVTTTAIEFIPVAIELSKNHSWATSIRSGGIDLSITNQAFSPPPPLCSWAGQDVGPRRHSRHQPLWAQSAKITAKEDKILYPLQLQKD